MKNIPKIAQKALVQEFTKILNTISYCDDEIFFDDLMEQPLDDDLFFDNEDYFEPFDLD